MAPGFWSFRNYCDSTGTNTGKTEDKLARVYVGYGYQVRVRFMAMVKLRVSAVIRSLLNQTILSSGRLDRNLRV